MLAALLATLLVACATQAPAPVETRTPEQQVQEEVRQPAEEESEGIQIKPLQNPAVIQLQESARQAEAAGDLGQAALLTERALRIQPRDPELLQYMAEIKLQQQDWEQAYNFAVRSHDAGPRVGELCSRNWRTIGMARQRMGDEAGASEAASRAQRCMVTKYGDS